MCTVTFMPSRGTSFVLTSNRDEAPDRETLAPATYKLNGTELLYPKDSLAGGTWVGLSKQQRIICLLNGGFKAHQRKASYRMSRGVVVTDLLLAENVIDAAGKYDLHDVEPFTLVIADWKEQSSLYQGVWDGSEMHLEELPWAPHIWSSSLLYTREMAEKRQRWFSDFLFQNLSPSNLEILEFHKSAGEGNPESDLLIDRGYVRTKSISQFKKNKDGGTFLYEILKKTKEPNSISMHSGRIIVLAYPDTFVTMSDEWLCRFLPLVGLGTREYIKAGHAALVLINNLNGDARYFDFGRYITPDGHGRVRSKSTDAELEIGFGAEFSSTGDLLNLDQFLLWLDANPHKTHGEGRLLASVCEDIDHDQALAYILGLQSRGSIPYGAFNRQGSNCSRFVTDTILSATRNKRIIDALKFNKRFTPSTVGNVEKATFGKIYEVDDGKVDLFRGTAFKENLKNYFHRKNGSMKKRFSDQPVGWSSNAQFLDGIGCGAWFEVVAADLPSEHFRIKRFNQRFEVDFDGVFVSSEFNSEAEYSFTYDSHCEYCHIIQEGRKIRLDALGSFVAFSSSRKVHSA